MVDIFNVAEKLGFFIEDDPLSQRVHYTVKKIISLNTPSEENLSKLLQSLNSDYYIAFFDYFHKQTTDPGAYITAVPMQSGYVYRAGNHGWSSDWKQISIAELCKYIIKNWKYDDGKNYKNYITIGENHYHLPGKT